MKKLLTGALVLGAITSAFSLELVRNGDFSTGTRGQDGWTEASPYTIIDDWADDDSFFSTSSAYLGGYNGAVDSISQQINFGILPGTATLRFDALFYSEDVPLYDFLGVGLSPFVLSNILVAVDLGDAAGGLNSGQLIKKSYVVDVSSYLGTGVRTLAFEVSTDSSGPSAAFIDNVSIIANPVPEPATMAIMGLGVAAMIRRRRK